jgi:hypothetical protein
MAQLATVAAADLPDALDRKIDVIMLVVPNPGPGLHERQRLLIRWPAGVASTRGI